MIRGFVEIWNAQIIREKFRPLRPFARRRYVLTYKGRRAGAAIWEDCVSFHDTLEEALRGLPNYDYTNSPMTKGEA